MTTHEYWIKHKKEMSEKHKEWAKKNPDYYKKYFWKNREKINEGQRVKDYQLPRWTIKEIELLIKEYPCGNLKKLANKLNRSIQAIQSRAERLNIFRMIRKNLGKKNGMWKGGIQYQYYRRIAFEHFPAICNICKKHFPNLEVHHKDRNRKNNLLLNLQILCKSCHEKTHSIKPNEIKRFIRKHKKYQPGTRNAHKKS